MQYRARSILACRGAAKTRILRVRGSIEIKGFSATTGVKATLVNAATEPLRGRVVGGVPGINYFSRLCFGWSSESVASRWWSVNQRCIWWFPEIGVWDCPISGTLHVCCKSFRSRLPCIVARWWFSPCVTSACTAHEDDIPLPTEDTFQIWEDAEFGCAKKLGSQWKNARKCDRD